MPLKRAIPAPTKAEARIHGLMRSGPCPLCAARGLETPVAEIHHARDYGRQISQRHVIPLCLWHHRGIQADGVGELEMLGRFGPSIHRHSRPWKEEWGTEKEFAEWLWAKYETEAAEIVG